MMRKDIDFIILLLWNWKIYWSTENVSKCAFLLTPDHICSADLEERKFQARK